MKTSVSDINTIESEINNTTDALRRGYVILYPTDTIWGIGCDIENKAAYERVMHIKKRKKSGAMVVLVNSIDMLQNYAPYMHPRIETLLTMYHRPLSIIYDKIINFQDHVLAEDGTVAIRVVNDEFCSGIIERLGRPILATAASLDEKLMPKTIEEVPKSIKDEVDYTSPISIPEQSDLLPSLLAKANKKGELVFIRK